MHDTTKEGWRPPSILRGSAPSWRGGIFRGSRPLGSMPSATPVNKCGVTLSVSSTSELGHLLHSRRVYSFSFPRNTHLYGVVENALRTSLLVSGTGAGRGVEHARLPIRIRLHTVETASLVSPGKRVQL